jgi:ATP-dependent DNA ligase
MDHVDLIIMGGYFGEGRRKGISHFLVGAAVPPTTEGECIRLCACTYVLEFVRLSHSSEQIFTLDHF